jgi:hypothetical protein
MFAVRAGTLAVVGVVALSATGVRIGDHHPYVRVVIDFNGNVPVNQVRLDKLTGTRASLHVVHPPVNTQTSGATADGVRVSVQPGTQGLQITTSSWRRRFKYVSYAVVGGNRLAIDLWKSVPRFIKPIHTCKRLTLIGWSANGSRVIVGGREHGLFENQFQVVVRGQNGAVLGRNIMHGPGRWRTRVRYHVTSSRGGTVEAVAFSPRDGSLVCIAQIGIGLPAT